MAKRCAELEEGTRRLLEWPDGPDDTEAWARPEAAMHEMIARVRSALGIDM